MATNNKFTLKRHNGTDFDTLYPLTTWVQVLDKPTTFTPTTHTHPYRADTWVPSKTDIEGVLTGTISTHTHSTGSPTAHNFIDTTGHPVSGLTGGHFLKAISGTTYGFAAHGLDAAAVGARSTSWVPTAAEVSTLDATHRWLTDSYISTWNAKSDAHTHPYLPLTGGSISGQLTSTVVSGTAPLVVASTTMVSNLNAQYLNGNASSAFAGASHSQAISTISDSTTVGQNLVKLANPNTLSYIKISETNEVSALTPAQVLSDIGAAASSHTHGELKGSYAALKSDASYSTISGTSLSLPANTKWLVIMTGQWYRNYTPGGTAYSYKQSVIFSSITSVGIAGSYSFANASSDTSDTRSEVYTVTSTAGTAGATMITSSSNTTSSYGHLELHLYVTVGATATAISLSHALSTAVTAPYGAQVKGGITAIPLL